MGLLIDPNFEIAFRCAGVPVQSTLVGYGTTLPEVTTIQFQPLPLNLACITRASTALRFKKWIKVNMVNGDTNTNILLKRALAG